jgi:glycosyltransferase involved in cell wall biosynthesis
VKLLEAFASGIPVVSTRLGAEGLAAKDGELCALADDPNDFADRVVELLQDPAKAIEMAKRARAEIVDHRDTKVMTERMIASYRAELKRKLTS